MTQQSLGSFGTRRDAVEFTFDYFDETVRVNPNLTDLAIVDLFSDMAEPEDGAAAIEGMRSMVSAIVHPDDLDAFWVAARSNRQTMEDVAQLAVQLIGALTNRPTKPLSDSSPSPSSDEPSSEGGSFSAAMEHLDGRPDLQAAVLRMHQQKAG